MNGKYFQPIISGDWEIHTEEDFYDFSYLGAGHFIIRGKKLFISWTVSSGYLNKYKKKE